MTERSAQWTATPCRNTIPALEPVSYNVDYWYRHDSDMDRSVRQHAQMGQRASSTEQIRRTIADLEAQGYTVQRVTFQAVCLHCNGDGRIAGKRNRGTVFAKYTDCKPCKGTGHSAGPVEYQL